MDGVVTVSDAGPDMKKKKGLLQPRPENPCENQFRPTAEAPVGATAMRPSDRPGLLPVPTPVCHWTGGFPASSDAGVTHLRCTFLLKALKMIFYPRFAVIFELILLYFLFNKLVICFICRILAFRSVTPVYPLRIRSHLSVSGPHAFASYIRARQRDFPWLYRQSRQRRPAPNRRIRQGSHHPFGGVP